MAETEDSVYGFPYSSILVESGFNIIGMKQGIW